ncbi:MAG: hypothetical protein ACFFEF_12765 [Candidatus Thorarchaeota archaeon]
MVILQEEGDINPGELHLPFSFEIPVGHPSTYHGRWSNVEYMLTAKLDIPWAFDIKSGGEVIVKSYSRPRQSRELTEISDHKQFPDLQVEIPRDVLCIGDDLIFRVCVSDERKIRGLRVDLINREWAKAKRVHRDGDRIILTKFFPEERILGNSWIKMRLKSSTKVPATYESEIMSSKVFLKVTMDIPWDFDTSIYLPIHTCYCPLLPDDDFSFESIY